MSSTDPRYYVELLPDMTRTEPVVVTCPQQPHWRKPRPVAWGYFLSLHAARTQPLQGADLPAACLLLRTLPPEQRAQLQQQLVVAAPIVAFPRG